jgi:hypothetical protein
MAGDPGRPPETARDRHRSAGTPFDAWHGLFTAPAHPGTLVQGAVTSIIWPVVLDVALKANGCYTAEAGSALGALLMKSWQGTTFLNPLYAFDGCFGTP